MASAITDYSPDDFVADKRDITVPQCKTCTHPKRSEIERLRFCEGYSVRKLADWYGENSGGDTIEIHALARHFKNHMTKHRYLQTVHHHQMVKKNEDAEKRGLTTANFDIHRLGQLEEMIVENMIMFKRSRMEIEGLLSMKVPEYYEVKDTKTGEVKEYIEVMKPPKVDKALIDLYKETQIQAAKQIETKLKILGQDLESAKKEKEADLINMMHARMKALGMKEDSNPKEEVDEDVIEVIDFGDEEDDE